MEDANKKFLASKFFHYKMVDGRHIIEQFHDVLHIISQFRQHNMNRMSLMLFLLLLISPSFLERLNRLNSLEEQAMISSKINIVKEEKEAKTLPNFKKNKRV